jgi:hypothetical protein
MENDEWDRIATQKVLASIFSGLDWSFNLIGIDRRWEGPIDRRGVKVLVRLGPLRKYAELLVDQCIDLPFSSDPENPFFLDLDNYDIGEISRQFFAALRPIAHHLQTELQNRSFPWPGCKAFAANVIVDEERQMKLIYGFI